jgi:predicted HTH transcriptional regulator
MLKWEKSTHTKVIFENSVDISSVTFPLGDDIKESADEENIENSAGIGITDIIQTKIEKVTEKGTENTEKVTEKGTENTENITKKQQLILDNISKNPYITADELAKVVEMSHRKIKENISKIKAKGLLERIGPDKGGYWNIIKETDKRTENAERVTEKQQMILDNISKNPSITIEELATNVSITKSKIKENISKLKAKGLLERIGPDKGGYWRVIKRNPEKSSVFKSSSKNVF